MEKLLTVREAADRLGVSAVMVYGWCNSGALVHHRLGLPGRRGTIRIAEADLQSFLDGRKRGERKETPPPPAPKPAKLKHLHLPS